LCACCQPRSRLARRSTVLLDAASLIEMSTITAPLLSSPIATNPPTPTFGTSNEPGTGNSGDNNPPSTAATSLYLYVFFAVLVIVVCSCSGVMRRSYVLRRQHRHPAVRNEWIPPEDDLEVGVRRGLHGMGSDTSRAKDMGDVY